MKDRSEADELVKFAVGQVDELVEFAVGQVAALMVNRIAGYLSRRGEYSAASILIDLCTGLQCRANSIHRGAPADSTARGGGTSWIDEVMP
jgi:hypothetical protein